MLGQRPKPHIINYGQVGLHILIEHAVAPLEGIVGEEVAHQIEDRTVANDETLLDRLVADGLGGHGFAEAEQTAEERVGLGADQVKGASS